MAKNCLHTNIIHRNRSLIEQGRYIATAVWEKYNNVLLF
jgi:hypothetical protein